MNTVYSVDAPLHVAVERPVAGWPKPESPQQFLAVWEAAKARGDRESLRRVCGELKQAWDQTPVWEGGQNRLSYQRQRLSPHIRYVPSRREEYYRAFVQVVLDPEFRRLAAEPPSRG